MINTNIRLPKFLNFVQMWVSCILFHVGELFPVSFISAYNLFFSRRHGRPLDFCLKILLKLVNLYYSCFIFKFIGTVFFFNDGNAAYLPLEFCVKLANIFCFIAKFIKLLLLKMSKELNLGFFFVLFLDIFNVYSWPKVSFIHCHQNGWSQYVVSRIRFKFKKAITN